jgi:hypothetical protein
LVKSSLIIDRYVPRKVLDEKKDSYVEDIVSSEQKAQPPIIALKFKTFDEHHSKAVV